MRSFSALCLILLLVAGCASVQSVSRDGMKAFELSLATSGDRAAVAWHGGTAELDAIFIQPLDAKTRPAGAPIQVTDGHRYAYEPDLQFLGSDLVLAWYEKDAHSGALSAWLARVDTAGRTIWRRQLDAAGGNARNVVVRVYREVIHVAWIETVALQSPVVWTACLGSDGSLRGLPQRAGAASTNTWNLNATLDAKGTFFVAYDAQLGTTANELRLLVINATGVRDVSLSKDDGFASVYPDIGISKDGVVAVTWFDERDGNEEVYLALGDIDDFHDGEMPGVRRITQTPTASIGAYLAWNGERLALLWCDAELGQQELYGQTFDTAGKPEADIRRLTTSLTQSSIPSVRAWRGAFLAAWNEYASTGEGIHRPITVSTAMVATVE